MSRADAWMPLYIGDYLADTMHLSAVEHGAYLLLLMQQWRSGPLPDDDRHLAAIARVDLAAWKRQVGPTIRRFFEVTADGLVQKRLEAERQKAAAIIEKRATAGKKGAARRWQNGEQSDKPSDGGEGSNSNGDGMANAMASATAGPLATSSQTDAQSQSQSHSTSSLRSDGASAAAPAADPEPASPAPSSPAAEPAPDARTALWREGLPRLQRMTGKTPAQARSLLGRYLRDAGDDCALLSAILFEAEQARPVQPEAWISGALRRRAGSHNAPPPNRRPHPQDAIHWMFEGDRSPPFDFDGHAEETTH